MTIATKYSSWKIFDLLWLFAWHYIFELSLLLNLYNATGNLVGLQVYRWALEKRLVAGFFWVANCWIRKFLFVLAMVWFSTASSRFGSWLSFTIWFILPYLHFRVYISLHLWVWTREELALLISEPLLLLQSYHIPNLFTHDVELNCYQNDSAGIADP